MRQTGRLFWDNEQPPAAVTSINRKLAKALVQLAPPELEMSEISFRELPLYSYDYDADFPLVARACKDAAAAVARLPIR